jgi:hypothetical protein
MSSYIVYVAGGALATSFMANNRWLKGLSFVMIGLLIGLMQNFSS